MMLTRIVRAGFSVSPIVTTLLSWRAFRQAFDSLRSGSCALIALVGLLGATAASADTRYLDEVFPAVDVTAGVPYGATTARCGGAVVENQTHLLDVYEPQGDVEMQRPVVVIVHGGAFAFGDRTDGNITGFADKLARRGYLTASISYRLCPELSPFTPATFPGVLDDARQDALAAVRFFRENAATWRADPERIALVGFSAGAITSLHAAYDRRGLVPSNDCCQDQPSNVCAVAALAGGVFAADIIDSPDPATLLVHHVNDPVVPVSGSQEVEAACLAVGVTVEAHYLNDTLPDYHNGLITYHEADILGWMVPFLHQHVATGPGCQSLCAAAPRSGCRAAGKSLLQMRRDANDAKDKIVYRWLQGEETAPADFGAPASTSRTALCLYDAGGQIASMDLRPGGMCGSKPCWQVKSDGFAFRDASTSQAGMKKTRLKSGAAGKAKIVAVGTGGRLPDPQPSFAPPITAQVVTDDPGGACFSSNFSASEVVRNDPGGFKATAP